MDLSKYLFGLLFIGWSSFTCAVTCPITNDHVIVFNADTAHGVGPGSYAWVLHFVSSLRNESNLAIPYIGLTGAQIAACDLSSFPNLQLYLEPGGEAFDQMVGLGEKGRDNIRNFVNRDLSLGQSIYAGFCAGGYLGSHAYVWESQYEGDAYFDKYGAPRLLDLAPYDVEGSIIDINDEQFGSYESGGTIKYRMVNVSNGYSMLYFGGSTMGYNQLPVPDDDNFQVLLYFEDFYGHVSPNIPAAWQYSDNILLTSIHPCADNTDCSDCPNHVYIDNDTIYDNRNWLLSHINSMLSTSWTTVYPTSTTNSTESSKKTRKHKSSRVLRTPSPPHDSYPYMPCYDESIDNGNMLFCDDFNLPLYTDDSEQTLIDIYPGLYQWQRNQSNGLCYDCVWPWNVTFSSTMMNSTSGYYGDGLDGVSDGWAVSIPMDLSYGYGGLISSWSLSLNDFSSVQSDNVNVSKSHYPIKRSFPRKKAIKWSPIIHTDKGATANPYYLNISYYYKGNTESTGLFLAEYSLTSSDTPSWTTLQSSPLSSAESINDNEASVDNNNDNDNSTSLASSFAWKSVSYQVPLDDSWSSSDLIFNVRFTCYAAKYAGSSDPVGLLSKYRTQAEAIKGSGLNVTASTTAANYFCGLDKLRIFIYQA